MRMRGFLILFAMLAGAAGTPAASFAAPPPRAAAKSAPAKPNAARAASNASIFATGPKIAKSAAVDNVDEDPCKQAYWSCMDMFCINENENGMRCQCSNESIKLNAEYNKILDEVETETAKSDAAIDEIESGDGVAWMRNKTAAEAASECAEDDEISCKTGAAKFAAVQKLCESQTTDECKANIAFTKLQYSQNIRNDCSAYVLAVKDFKLKGAAALYAAKKAARDAALEKLESANALDSAQCSDELRACMSGPDVCGSDWTRCLDGGVEEKKFHCEKVLEQCQSVADGVWTAFAANIGNILNAAALDKENASRTSCLGNISQCVMDACRDDIEGKGVDTIDACLARPEMAASFCKVEMDNCGIDTSGAMWTFVRQKLGAMRVDRCMDEVKTCLTAEDRCGQDYSKCLGMDLNALYRICPADKLVVCKEANPDFAITDLGDMLMGIFLNIDNEAYDQCQELVVEKMTEVCGSLVNCNGFTDPKMGTRGLRYQEENGMYLITGIVNWAGVSVENGDEWSACAGAAANGGEECGEFPKPGAVKVWQYADEMAAAGTVPELANLIDASNKNAEDELGNVAAEINRIAGLIEDDPKISMCANGRDMSQITGNDGDRTEARFPLLTATYRRVIAEAALAAAAKNQDAEVANLMTQAEGKADLAALEYMCYMKPHMVGGRVAPDPAADGGTVAAGSFGSIRMIGKAASKQEISDLAGTQTVKMDDILTKQMTAGFTPETKICRICVVDVFHGKRKYVEPRAKMSEDLKKTITDLDSAGEQDREGVKNATIAALSVAGTLAFVPVVGWAASGAIAAGALITSAILQGTTQYDDPMEQTITAEVDYCVDEPMGN